MKIAPAGLRANTRQLRESFCYSLMHYESVSRLVRLKNQPIAEMKSS